MVTAGSPSAPTVIESYAIPTGQWCSSYQAEMKAVKKALQIIQAKDTVR